MRRPPGPCEDHSELSRLARRERRNPSVRSVIAAFALLLLAACGGREAPAPVPPPAALGVHDAWTRAADSGMVTAVYFTLRNTEAAGVTLTGASSPIAESVTLHETHEMSGMVHMMALDSAVVVPGDSVVLAEGGKHFMVNGLRRKLVAGDTIPLTLTFSSGRTLDIRVGVRAPF